MNLRADVELALQQGRPERAWDLAAKAYDEQDLCTRNIAFGLLRALRPRVPAAAWTEDRKVLALRTKLGVPDSPDTVGVMHFPAVGALGDRFVRVRVVSGADALAHPLRPDQAAVVGPALEAARGLLGLPAQAFSVHFDDMDWTGESAGLAVALAAVSAARNVPLSARLCASGAMSSRGQVLPVADMDRKQELRRAAWPAGHMLVPGDLVCGHCALLPVSSLQEAWARVSGQAEDLEQRVRQVRDLDRQGDWLGAARTAALLEEEPELLDEERLELLALLLSAANHSADTSAQDRTLAQLNELLASWSADKPTTAVARAFGARVVAAVDQLNPEKAQAALHAAQMLAFEAVDRVHLLGPEALLRTLQGDLQGALALREQSVSLASSDELPRCLGDLADAQLRLGRVSEALAAVDAALEQVQRGRRRTGYLRQTQYFLRLHRARCLAQSDPQGARQALAALDGALGLDPRLRGRLLQAEMDADPAQINTLEAELGSAARAVLLQALLDRSRARLGDAQAQARLLALPVFSGVDLDEASRRLPY